MQSWGHSETEHLIDLCIENDVPVQMESKKYRNEEIFSKIRDGMAVGGYKRDVSQLYNKYRKLKGSINLETAKTKSGRSEIPFFDKLETLFSDRLPKVEVLIDDTYGEYFAAVYITFFLRYTNLLFSDEDYIEEANDDFADNTLSDREEWEYTESEKFIDLCIQNNIVARLGSKAERKADLFEALQEELRLAGYDREASQLINQFHKLKESYKKARQIDSTDVLFYDKLDRLFEITESTGPQRSPETKNSTGVYDVYDFINTIRRNPIIWNTQYKCSPYQREKTWEVIAANYGLDCKTPKNFI